MDGQISETQKSIDEIIYIFRFSGVKKKKKILTSKKVKRLGVWVTSAFSISTVSLHKFR